MPVVSTPSVSCEKDGNARSGTVPIGFFDTRPQHEALEVPLRQAFERVLANGAFILGREVAHFENECCNRLGTEHAVGVSSGSDAIFLALRALGIGPGDEVITTAFTFAATAEAIVRTGATPVFADIRRGDLCLCPTHAERMIGARTRAILYVHLYGNTGSIAEHAALCRREGLHLVEDACQAFGAQAQGRAAGTWGDIGCFSFFPSKPLGALGDGGLCVTRAPELAQRLRQLRVHGFDQTGTSMSVSGNFRLDALQAALLLPKLAEVERFRVAREQIAHRYCDELRHCRGLALPSLGSASTRHAWSIFTLRVEGDRAELSQHLTRHGIESRVYYPHALSTHPAFDSRCRCGVLDQTNQAIREVLSIPIYFGLTPQSQDRIIESLAKWLGR